MGCVFRHRTSVINLVLTSQLVDKSESTDCVYDTTVALVGNKAIYRL